jgi:hypothetical protein
MDALIKAGANFTMPEPVLYRAGRPLSMVV